MNRLLGIVLDVEYLYTCVHKEEDADTKQVYFSLFKVSFYNQTMFHILHPLCNERICVHVSVLWGDELNLFCSSFSC